MILIRRAKLLNLFYCKLHGCIPSAAIGTNGKNNFDVNAICGLADDNAADNCTVADDSDITGAEMRNREKDLCDPTQYTLESWNYAVSGNGRLKVNVPFHLQVSSLNPMDFPQMDRVFVKLIATKSEGGEDSTIRLPSLPWKDIYKFKSNFMGDFMRSWYDVEVEGQLLNEQCLQNLVSLTCVINIPLQYVLDNAYDIPKNIINAELDIDVSNKGDVVVENVESRGIDVNCDKGCCRLNNVKSQHISVFSQGGDIISQKVLQGNMKLVTKNNGAINADRLQGQTLHCETESGSIHVASIYANKSLFKSSAGSLHLGSCHGNTTTTTKKGNTNIKSVDGHLTAASLEGDMDVTITRHEDVALHNILGNITINIPESLKASFDLTAKAINVEQQLNMNIFLDKIENKQRNIVGTINSHGGKLQAIALSGSIHVKTRDWLSSLNLQFKEE